MDIIRSSTEGSELFVRLKQSEPGGSERYQADHREEAGHHQNQPYGQKGLLSTRSPS